MFLPRTDGLLDAGTALAGLDAGHLLAVSAMDHRLSVPQAPGVGPMVADLINSDLYAADSEAGWIAAGGVTGDGQDSVGFGGHARRPRKG